MAIRKYDSEGELTREHFEYELNRLREALREKEDMIDEVIDCILAGISWEPQDVGHRYSSIIVPEGAIGAKLTYDRLTTLFEVEGMREPITDVDYHD